MLYIDKHFASSNWFMAYAARKNRQKIAQNWKIQQKIYIGRAKISFNGLCSLKNFHLHISKSYLLFKIKLNKLG